MREAEENIVGTLLTTADWNDEVLPIVEPQMFEDGLLGKLYFEIRRAYENGNTPDIAYLQTRVTEYPPEIVSQALHASIVGCECYTVKTSARVVVDEYNARQVEKMLSEVRIRGGNLYETVEKLRTDLDGIRISGEESRPLSEIAQSRKGEYFRQRERKVVDTGFEKLDKDLGGLEGGDMIVIGARPAVGKSAFALQLASQMASTGKVVQVFNLEMTEKQVYERMLSYESGIPLFRIRTADGFMNEEESIRFDNANKIMAERPNLLVSTGGKSVSEIRKSVKAKKPDIVIIDYLQLLKSDSSYRGNRYAEVGQISHAIKALAIDNKIPVIVLTQLNRGSENRDDREPSMAEIRESGDIEQDASIIILLWNKDKDDRSQKGCKIEKNRQGQTGKYDFWFNGSEMRFEEPKDGTERRASKADLDELPFAAD